MEKVKKDALISLGWENKSWMLQAPRWQAAPVTLAPWCPRPCMVPSHITWVANKIPQTSHACLLKSWKILRLPPCSLWD